MPDFDSLLDALHRALTARPEFRAVPRDALVPLAGSGIAHDHVRVTGVRAGGTRTDGLPVLLRVPRLSQWGSRPEAHLAYQAAAFERAAASGHTPRLLALLPVSPALPWGALVVEEIAGRKPRLPGDMAAIARCLAALHALPLPPAAARPPLAVHDDPAAATLAVIEEQAGFLDAAGLAAGARALVEDELAWAREFCRRTRAEDSGSNHPIALVATDAHPGNFIMAESTAGDRRAVFVDLEKVLYGSPAIDLAHATLYTSTRWDPDCAAALAPEETAGFYRAYLDLAGAEASRRLAPWLLPMRRLTWLRTLTWCARWRVLSRDGAASPWSAANLPPGLARHVEATVEDYFDGRTIAAIRAEWREGGPLLALLQSAA